MNEYKKEKPKEPEIEAILSMEQSENLSSLLEDLSKYVKVKGEKVNSSQLRNIFSKVLQANDVLSLQLIRPKLMYVAARQTNYESKEVVEFLEKIIVEVKKPEQVTNFKIFMEAFIAYHKYHHPRSN